MFEEMVFVKKIMVFYRLSVLSFGLVNEIVFFEVVEKGSGGFIDVGDISWVVFIVGMLVVIWVLGILVYSW